MAHASQPDPRTVAVSASLSRPRLAPYLAVSGNNLRDALRLYQWNIDISGAVYESLHVFEVILRNAMDPQLRTWNARQVNADTGAGHDLDWIMDPAPLLQRLVGRDIQRARTYAARALGRGDRQPSHDDVLTQLSFGTWRFLLPDSDPGRKLLWEQALQDAFPHLDTKPAVLVKEVSGIYTIRNRVAHLEPLLRPNIVWHEFKAMRSVLRAIDPVLEEWFVSRQRITPLLKQRPRHIDPNPPQGPATQP